ncbi:hypothetical protein JCM8208_003898, partial [Rhodotorula glutinis]
VKLVEQWQRKGGVKSAKDLRKYTLRFASIEKRLPENHVSTTEIQRAYLAGAGPKLKYVWKQKRSAEMDRGQEGATHDIPSMKKAFEQHFRVADEFDSSSDSTIDRETRTTRRRRSKKSRRRSRKSKRSSSGSEEGSSDVGDSSKDDDSDTASNDGTQSESSESSASTIRSGDSSSSSDDASVTESTSRRKRRKRAEAERAKLDELRRQNREREKARAAEEAKALRKANKRRRKASHVSTDDGVSIAQRLEQLAQRIDQLGLDFAQNYRQLRGDQTGASATYGPERTAHYPPMPRV